MTSLRTILLLLVVAVLSVALNLFFALRAPRLFDRALKTLLDPAFEPTSFMVARANGEKVVLARDGAWRLVSPAPEPADEPRVLRLLDDLMAADTLDTLSVAQMAKIGVTREDLGLVAPALRLSLSDGVETRVVSFGRFTPASNGVYAAVSGSDFVRVVPRAVYESANLGLDEARSRSVFPYDGSFVTGFEVRGADGANVSFSREAGDWRSEGRTVSSKKVEAFLSSLVASRIKSFCGLSDATNDVARVAESRLVGYGLDEKSALSLTIHGQDGVDRRLRLGRAAETGETYALIHDPSLVVTLADDLKAAALDLVAPTDVDRRLFPLEESAVSALTLRAGDLTCVLARGEGGQWRLESPVSANADGACVAALLTRLVALTTADLDPKGVRVSVSTNGEASVVSARALLGEATLADLRSKEIVKIDPSLVKRLVITPGAGGEAIRLVQRRESRTWAVEGAEMRRAVREEALKDFLAALNPLLATRIVALSSSAADLSRDGLETPFYTISIDQEKSGSIRRNLFIGAKTTGGRYATIGSAEAVFVLPEKTVEALIAPLVEEKESTSI